MGVDRGACYKFLDNVSSNHAMARIAQASLDYMKHRRCPMQWRSLLLALGSELSQRMETDQLRSLMFSTGSTMADSLPLAAAQTTKGLEAAFNDVWGRIDWGYVQLVEEADYLSIVHHCSPLESAFGESSLEWSIALLEGAYARWFDNLGAGHDLVLRQVSVPESGDLAVEFRLGQLQVVGPLAAELVP